MGQSVFKQKSTNAIKAEAKCWGQSAPIEGATIEGWFEQKKGRLIVNREAPAGFWLRMAAHSVDLVLVFGSAFLAYTLLSGIETSQQLTQLREILVHYGLEIERLYLIGLFSFAEGATENHLLQFFKLEFWLVFIVTSLLPGLMEWSPLGGSPGKLILGLKVVRRDGGRPGLASCYFRNFFKIFSAPLCLGYMIIFFNPDRQCFHDCLTDLHIVKDVERAPYSRFVFVLLGIVTQILVPALVMFPEIRWW